MTMKSSVCIRVWLATTHGSVATAPPPSGSPVGVRPKNSGHHHPLQPPHTQTSSLYLHRCTETLPDKSATAGALHRNIIMPLLVGNGPGAGKETPGLKSGSAGQVQRPDFARGSRALWRLPMVIDSWIYFPEKKSFSFCGRFSWLGRGFSSKAALASSLLVAWDRMSCKLMEGNSSIMLMVLENNVTKASSTVLPLWVSSSLTNTRYFLSQDWARRLFLAPLTDFGVSGAWNRATAECGH